MEIIAKLKRLVELVSSGQVWTQRKEAMLLVLQILTFVGENFVNNSEDMEPELESIAPYSDKLAIEEMTALIAAAETHHFVATPSDGTEAFTISPFINAGLRAWLLQLLTKLIMRKLVPNG